MYPGDLIGDVRAGQNGRPNQCETLELGVVRRDPEIDLEYGIQDGSVPIEAPAHFQCEFLRL